jgi:hypothetical protein
LIALLILTSLWFSVTQRHLHGIECGHELVQFRALGELLATLQRFRGVVVNIFMGEQGAGVVNTAQAIKRLVCALLRLCAVDSTELRVKSSECLGEIGAIDPARIGLLPRMVRETFGTESDDEFVIEIICDHLVRILKKGTASSSGQTPILPKQYQVTVVERVHFTVQELLRFLSCKAVEFGETSSKAVRAASFSQHSRSVHEGRPSKVASSVLDQGELLRGKENWSRLPPEVQQIVKPFLAGHLVYTEMIKGDAMQYKLTYVKGMPLQMWACYFQRSLISRMKGNRAAVFEVVRPLLKYDTTLNIFLLPHTVFDIVCHGSDADRCLVKDEMLHVLHETSSLEVEIDHGIIVCEQGRRMFTIESSVPKSRQTTNYIGNLLQIGSESRRIIMVDSGKQIVVDHPFSEPLHLENPSGRAYTVNSTSRWSTGNAAGCGENNAESCNGSSITQQVFGLIECFARWYEQAKSLGLKRPLATTERVTAGAALPPSGSAGTLTDQQKMANVSAFISAIPKRILAETSFRCGAFDRALLYLEISVRESWKSRLPPPLEVRCDQETVKLLQHIYAGLDDVDGLMGVAKLRGISTLEEQVLDSERAGDWTAALACYEQASQEDPKIMKNHHGLLRCLRNLGHLQTMLTHAEGCMNSFPHETAFFRDSALQASWRLGRWEFIEELLSKKGGTEERKRTFDFNLAQVLLDAKARNNIEFCRNIRRARISVLGPLAAAGMESYQRAYPFLVRLQMLSELQNLGAVLIETEGNDSSLDISCSRAKILIKGWDLRIQVTQPSLLGREPLLALRRVLFELLDMKDEVADGWLQFARAARSAGHISTAHSAIMQADRFGACRAHIERAKLKWSNPADRHESLRVLRDYLDRHRGLSIRGDEQVFPRIKKSAYFLFAKYQSDRAFKIRFIPRLFHFIGVGWRKWAFAKLAT